MTSSNDIRDMFLNYFNAREHEIVASSPLVPGNDPTLLFTNAGMVQFKDVFLGTDRRPYKRATTSQRCVRAGGKHNDLENVGYTARHHTFFEMLGNFSFGDYFKREAIEFCWDLLTNQLGLPAERLWVTVYEDDQEAEDIWFNHIGIDRTRFSRCSAKDNFWSMGDTGPCGPCSEVFYDHGPGVAGGPPGSPEEDGDRYIEIWNLVFMQFNRDAQGEMTPLPKPSVDTGMGLERLAAVLQNVHSNYEIDLFRNLIEATANVTNASTLEDKSLRVIADHIRSCAFLVVDGVVPSNEGRGYVLRRIIRRAVRHGHKLGVTEPFFFKLVDPLSSEMGAAYPELVQRASTVQRVLQQEEERFAETLEQGMRILTQTIEGLSDKEIPGDTVFKLYDTYGFPIDLTADIARERGLSVDMAAFDLAMEEQRVRARAASQFEAVTPEEIELDVATEFTGYQNHSGQASIVALVTEKESVKELGPGRPGVVVLNETPFYAEGGGQVGDRGNLVREGTEFVVNDTKRFGTATAHVGTLTRGTLRVGDVLQTAIDQDKRLATARNHSATHLLHAALRKILGEHVTQKGSMVAADRLRFDFSHFSPLTVQEVTAIEAQVNQWILHNDEALTMVMPLEEAKASGAIALFGEKYDDPVRVLKIGDYSTELCGGTHVTRSGDLGLFKITSESGIAAGVRRIEALTGDGARDWVTSTEDRLVDITALLKADREGVVERVKLLLAKTRDLEKEVERYKARLAAGQGDDLSAQAVAVGDLNVLAAKIEGADSKALRDTVDQLKNKLGSAAVVLMAVDGGKVSVVAGVSKDYCKQIPAGQLVNYVAEQVGGRGGGRADLAQAGGNKPEKVDHAIGSVVPWVESMLSS